MKKIKGFAIFITALMLITVFGACYTASADGVVSLGIYVRKEGTEDPINPAKVNVWYTRLGVPVPEEKPAQYNAEEECWVAGAMVKQGERVSFKIRVEVGDTEQIREVYDLVEDPNIRWYKEYFYFHVNDNSRNKNLLLVNFLEQLFEKFNWPFPILRVLHWAIVH